MPRSFPFKDCTKSKQLLHCVFVGVACKICWLPKQFRRLPWLALSSATCVECYTWQLQLVGFVGWSDGWSPVRLFSCPLKSWPVACALQCPPLLVCQLSAIVDPGLYSIPLRSRLRNVWTTPAATSWPASEQLVCMCARRWLWPVLKLLWQAIKPNAFIMLWFRANGVLINTKKDPFSYFEI